MIRFGVHYEYPFGGTARRKEWAPKGPDDWNRDCAAIRDTGFDIVRIRIGQDSDLDEVAQQLDVMREHELDVVFGFATFYAPWWFIEKHPDSRTVDRDGNHFGEGPNDFRWPRVCIHHPAYRQSRDELIDACASRFMDHPAVVVWDVHNEPSLGNNFPCYCAHTLAAYREAVASEFDSIAAYNEFTGQSLASLVALEPPRSPDGGKVAWRHWREFLTADMSEFLIAGREIVKRHNTNAIVTSNIDPISEWNVQNRPLDPRVVREFDLVSKSHYAACNDGTAGAGVSIAAMKALAGDKELWVTEFQAGPSRPGSSELFDRVWTGREIELELNCMVGHGSRGMILYRWEPLIEGPETGGFGLTEVGDHDTERRLTTKRAIERLRELEPVIERAKSRPPRIAVYLRQHQLHDAEERRGTVDQFRGPLYEAMIGHYGLCNELGYETGVLVDDPDKQLPYELVSFPWMYAPGDEDVVHSVLAAGKRVIVELPGRDMSRALEVAAAFGLKATGTEYPGLHDVSGGWNLRADADVTGPIAGYAYDNRVLLSEAEDQRVLLRFGGDGAPAAVIPDGWDERLLILAFPLGQSYAHAHHWALRETMGEYLGNFLAPDIRVSGIPRELSPLVETRVLEGEAGSLAIVLNRSQQQLELELAVSDREVAHVVVAARGVAHVEL